MEIKKSPRANLEKQKGGSFLLGLVLALSLIYVGLEWRSVSAEGVEIDRGLDVADIEDVLLIQQEQPEQPPEPEVVPEQTIEVALPEEFKVVDDSKEVAKVVLVSADEDRELPPPAPIIQAPVEEEAEDTIFEVVEEQPVPPGGSIEAMLTWIQKNLVYPERALDNNIQGRVVVQFVVEKDGSVSQPKVVRGVDPLLDKEALRVVSKMGKWQPGKQRGKAVRSRYSLPIVFKIG